MGIRKEIPGGDLVTEYYNRIKAKTLAALLAYVPEDVNIPATCEETGRIYTYSNGTWWSGCHPIYADYPTAKSKVFQIGDECLIPKLVGVGTIRLRYESTGRLAVDAGQCVAAQNDPHSVVTASGTSAVDFTWLTIPAGMFGDGEEWEVTGCFETLANTGNDSSAILIGGQSLLSGSTSPLKADPTIARLVRYSGQVLRTLSQYGTTLGNSVIRASIDFNAAQTIILRDTPAMTGNSSYFRRVQIRRLS